jgi:hypothetical protein
LLILIYKPVRGRYGNAELPSFFAFAARMLPVQPPQGVLLSGRGALEAISLSAVAAS